MGKLFNSSKPFILIVFGSLLFLSYLNWFLTNDIQTIIIAVFAVVIAAYYITHGVLEIVLKDKLGKAKNILEIISIVLFPIFFFIRILLVIIDIANLIGPTGWVIGILSLIGTLAFVVIYLIKVVPKTITRLFGNIFALILLLNILFDVFGNPISLGNINVVTSIAYISFDILLFTAISTKIEEEKQINGEI